MAREPHHQVEADIVEARASRVGERRARAIGAVQPRQAPQLVVSKRLDAEAQSIDAGVAVLRQARGGDGFRVGLEGDFTIGGDVERRFARGDDAGNLRRLERPTGPLHDR